MARLHTTFRWWCWNCWRTRAWGLAMAGEAELNDMKPATVLFGLAVVFAGWGLMLWNGAGGAPMTYRVGGIVSAAAVGCMWGLWWGTRRK
jgi:hypothetical protein